MNRLLKNAHLRRSPPPSGALHLDIFDQPEKKPTLNGLLKTENDSLPPLRAGIQKQRGDSP